ncbi:TIGR03943 family protein [Paenibacillus selenitireducens]|uniref:TIGR03943 family protein n=1 Tax=Paenibacillus selenitireducens TaxID=1324314 RepID=A0A1T2X2V2_9BACL|nr:TIGR03943 family protein [Paenibacillus selenitireducens]OPA73913.1 TIGR03943 family protein [Paenibacillus selenitireducens]
MRKINADSIHHFTRAFILLGFAVMIGYLVISGQIQLYVVPQLEIYLKITGVILLLIAIFQLYISIISLNKKVILCDCGDDHSHSHDHSDGHNHDLPRGWWKNIAFYGLFILPLLLGLALPNIALAGSLVQTKGIHLGGASLSTGMKQGAFVELDGNEDPELKAKFKTDVYNKDYAKLGMKLYQEDTIVMKDEWFIEKLQALNTFVGNFVGKPITIKGFIYREAGMTGTEFIIGRMAMTHCIADISPYGIIAESMDASAYADDSWVSISGIIEATDHQGQKVMKINVEKIEPADAPEVPYVYPDWDFASKL